MLPFSAMPKLLVHIWLGFSGFGFGAVIYLFLSPFDSFFFLFFKKQNKFTAMILKETTNSSDCIGCNDCMKQ